jgi:hypothetical protein
MRPGRAIRPHVHALFGLYQVSNDETITNVRRRPGPADHYTDNYAALVFGATVRSNDTSAAGRALAACPAPKVTALRSSTDSAAPRKVAPRWLARHPAGSGCLTRRFRPRWRWVNALTA